MLDTPKFTTRTPTATVVEQPEPKFQIGKFLQSEHQPSLLNVKRLFLPRQEVTERTQTVMGKMLEAITGTRNIQCPSLLPVTIVPHPDEVLDSKRSQIDKILQKVLALALYNFKVNEGLIAYFMERGAKQLVIDVISILIHNLMEAERTLIARSRNGNRVNANYYNLIANTINSYLNRQTAQRLLESYVIAKSDVANKIRQESPIC
ncbi:MAG: hypothetical protein EZS28_009563 [Streblomastix strix]|uniref:Uncharacterized protein n=1 Tax=Streblomastix strix TaxID=222440 RepID=A0A5J4WKT1_9EUKA|nr:MAG: hypothetical protein EZS28_009563 [Streblomastix strix]